MPYWCAWDWARPSIRRTWRSSRSSPCPQGPCRSPPSPDGAPRPDARYFVGSGKAEELQELAARAAADVILVDHALSPSQERNLEKLTERRVLDRNG